MFREKYVQSTDNFILFFKNVISHLPGVGGVGGACVSFPDGWDGVGIFSSLSEFSSSSSIVPLISAGISPACTNGQCLP